MSVTVAETNIVPAIADWIKRGKCILFLGAGVHSPPPEDSPYTYAETQRPPLGTALARHLADAVGFADHFPNEPVSNLQRVSLFYQIQHSRQQLISEVQRAVDKNKQPSPLVRALGSLDFPLVITTNYDRLFEKALMQAGKDPFIGVYKKNDGAEKEGADAYPDMDDPTPDRPFVFKIHGDVQQPESVVITDEDYVHFVLRMTEKDQYAPIPQIFNVRLAQWPVLFIGYSLMDFNFRLLFKTLRWKLDESRRPPSYSVDLQPDLLIVKVWQGHVSFVVKNVWTFVPELYRHIKGEEMPS